MNIMNPELIRFLSLPTKPRKGKNIPSNGYYSSFRHAIESESDDYILIASCERNTDKIEYSIHKWIEPSKILWFKIDGHWESFDLYTKSHHRLENAVSEFNRKNEIKKLWNNSNKN